MMAKKKRSAPKRHGKSESVERPSTLTITGGAPRIKISGTGERRQIGPDHPDRVAAYALLMDAIGTKDVDFLNGILGQIANASAGAENPNEQALNFMLSVIKGIKPKDQFETMLAAQMAAVHAAFMSMARYLANNDNLLQLASYERALNKLARTFAAQLDTFKRYRTGGEQKVTVQHVSVSEGGQAIVGNVTQSPRDDKTDKAAASPPALTDARTPAMPIINEDKERAAVPARSKKRPK